MRLMLFDNAPVFQNRQEKKKQLQISVLQHFISILVLMLRDCLMPALIG